jgi:membrane-associated protease RseP (regulator of RpoE activity)
MNFNLHAHGDDDAVVGIKASHIGEEKAEKLNYPMPYGSRIDRLYPDAAAQQAGLKPMDYIYAINGKNVSRNQSLSDLLEDYQPGKTVEVTFLRQGQSQTQRLTLSRRGDLDMPHRDKTADPFLGIGQRHDELPEGINGTAVNITDNSTAQAMGLEDGDIITAIDGFPVIDWHDMNPLIDMREVGDAIELTVYRNGETFTRSRPIKSTAATHNSHSRPYGPAIIQPEPATEASIEAQSLPPIAQVELQSINPQEITQLNFLEPVATEDDTPVEATATASTNSNPATFVRNLQVETLNVFPNPTTGIFDIQFELPERGETAVYIYNPAGQPVYFNTLGDFSGTFSDRIDIANGVRGIYFLELRQGQQRLTRKIVLQ